MQSVLEWVQAFESLPAAIAAWFGVELLNGLTVTAKGWRWCQNCTEQYYNCRPSGSKGFTVQWPCWQMSPAHHHLWVPQTGRRRRPPALRLQSEQQTPADGQRYGYKRRSQLCTQLFMFFCSARVFSIWAWMGSSQLCQIFSCRCEWTCCQPGICAAMPLS